MYTIINNTQKKNYTSYGDYPLDLIEYMLNNGDDIIVISSYSNTIKIPVGLSTDIPGEWEWKEYKYDCNMFI